MIEKRIMITRARKRLTAIGMIAGVVLAAWGSGGLWADDEGKAETVVKAPATVEEARARARLLHETIHGSLQVVHRDFFDPDDRTNIPSKTMKDVFKVLSKDYGVDVRWLGVEGKTMDVDHHPQDDFERNAVAALKGGKDEFEAVEEGRYRHAGSVQLHNRCLKCHVPNRTSLGDRKAGLVISMKFGTK